MRSWVTLFIGGCGLLLATRVHALGIGEPLTVSPLNRPLHAVLPLTASAKLEPAQVTVTLADAAAYRRAGLTPDALGDGISARVEKRDGGLAIVLDSDQRVREPFLDLLLSVSWPQGQWQRDVSLLFDLPDYAATRPPLAAAGASSAGSRAAAWPQTLTVAPGATLSTLAAALPPHRGVSRQAAMLALYRANRGAFVGGNLDRLRAGARLDVPPADTVAALADQAPQALRALREAATDMDPGSPAGSERVGQQRPARAPGSDDTEALARQVAALTQQTQRQQATIADLERQRDQLRATLAARATPLEAGESPARNASAGEAAVVAASSTPTSSTSTLSTSAATSSPSPAKSTSLTPSTPPAATAPNASAAAPSLWERAVSWAPLLGALAILALLWALLWQRRRARAQIAHMGENEMKGDAPEAHVELPVTPRHRAPGKLLGCIKRGGRRRGAQQDVAETETGDAAISQADIYIAYGRFAAAREWLESRLTEDPRHRLSLIRALGELREIEAMEQVLAEFDDSASREQRRTAEALAADYRARYVDESRAVATDNAKAAAADTAAAAANLLAEDEEALSLARVEDVDALFDAALGGETSPLPQSPLPRSPAPETAASSQASSTPEAGLTSTETPSSDSAPIGRVSTPPEPEGADAESVATGADAAPTLALEPSPHDFEVAPETLGAAPPPKAARSALGAGKNSAPAALDGEAQGRGMQKSGGQRDSAEQDDEGPDSGVPGGHQPADEKLESAAQQGDTVPLVFADDRAPQAWRIDYQPPTLDLDDAPTSPATPSDDAAPEIELPPLDLDAQTWRPLGEPAPAEVPSQSGMAASDGVSVLGRAPGSPAAGNKSAEHRSAENKSAEKTSPQRPSISNTSKGNTSEPNASQVNASQVNTSQLNTSQVVNTPQAHAAPAHPSSGKASPQHPVSPGDTSLQRGIPVGWEVEEVEFEPLHRDNGRP